MANSPSFMETELLSGKQPSRLELGTSPTAGRPPTETVHLHRGEIWGGDFELGPLIGKGGMGAVYAGRQISLERAVAIKALRVHLSEDPELIARFEQEAKWLARISSPHVIQVHAFGKHRNHHFLVMELIEGEDLGRKLKSGWRPTHAESVALVAQAAHGLSAAGEHGIVHRDIKPGNMLLTLRGVLKVTDFGLARLVHGSSTISSTGVILGTDAYMSPEQCQGLAVDQRSDIYSLGVVFYELLCGQRPFAGETHMEVFIQHIDRAPRSPRLIDPTIPPEVESVVLTCLAKDPIHRYQSATELLDDLQRVAAHQWPAKRLHVPPRALRFWAALLVILALGLLVLHLGWPHGATAATPAGSFSAMPLPDGTAGGRPFAGQIPAPAAATTQLLASSPEPGEEPSALAAIHRSFSAWQTRDAQILPAARMRQELAELVTAATTLGGAAPWLGSARGILAGLPDGQLVPTPAWAAHAGMDDYGRWAECVTGDYLERFYWCPPGRFPQSTAEPVAGPGGAVRTVVLSQGFWMAAHELSNRQWQALMPASGRDSNDLPVTLVSWEQAQACCARLSAMARCRAVLPTEAQWEYACRAGRDWHAEDITDLAWTQANTSELHTVGSKSKNPWGLYDCFGNANEWCADWYGPLPPATQPVRDPAGPAGGTEHVARGGDILQPPERCLPTARFHFETQTTLETLGFRILIRQ